MDTKKEANQNQLILMKATVKKQMASTLKKVGRGVHLVGFLVFPLFNFAQSKNERVTNLSGQWVSENVHSIKLNTDELKDLEFLKNEVGNKRIVAIGEQTHNDGATFQLRGKMIEYLIEEMGFEVILFEAGMFDLHYANESVKRSMQIDSLRNGILWFWKNANQHDHLFAYLQQQLQKGKELEFGGFDCKLTSSYGRKNGHYANMLKALVKTLDSQFFSSADFVSYLHVWDRIDADMKKGGLGSFSFKMNAREQADFLKQSQFIQQWLFNKGQLEWAQMVNTIDKGIVLYADFSIGKALFNKEWLLNLNNGRDSLMAENLQYQLATKYANKKVILFGATYHFARNIQTITPSKVRGLQLDKSVTTGGILHPMFHNEIYTIGFTAHEGTYGYVKKGGKGKSVKKASSKSLSYQLVNQKYDAAFVPLKNISANSQYWSNGAIIRFLDYKTDTAAPDWSAVMDAVVYIKTMTPITY